MVQIIDGKKIADEIKKEIKDEVSKLKIKPGLAIILVGDDEPSHIYVNLKKKLCEECDINIHRYLFTENSPESDIIQAIKFLNDDPDVSGIIVQLPLPKKFNTDKIIKSIVPEKDVDGFHPDNLKLIKKNTPRVISGLALGILMLIKSTEEKIKDKNCVIISNSKIFAIPLEYLLKKEGGKIITIFPNDKNLQEITKSADILIVSVGKTNFIKKSFVKKDVVIIDVGINRLKNNKIIGDVSLDVQEKASFITPVPGGVGPMTVVMLLYNTLFLHKKIKNFIKEN